MKEIIICVDEKDKELGYIEKMDAHIKGVLHRALSVFIFNEKNELLLQKRYSGKYHSPSLWTNTCCTHPNKNEDTAYAAKRRLQEEMGFSCDLKEVFSFIYYIKFDNNLIEHEFDHVYFGKYSDKVYINDVEQISGSSAVDFDKAVSYKLVSSVDGANEMEVVSTVNVMVTLK